ncbi:MAG: signal transduction histidine kinase/CheY-like chemotaxis protein [Arcticibacterium sp.]
MSNTSPNNSRWYQHHIFDNKNSTVLPAQVMILADDSNDLSFNTVKDLGNNYFIRLSEIKKFETDKTYWAKVLIKNSSGYEKDMIVQPGNNAESTIYIVRNESTDSLKTGYFVPIKERAIKVGFESKFRLRLGVNETVFIYVKTKSLDNYNPNFNFLTLSYYKWQEDKISENYYMGIFNGLTFVLAIVGFAFYLFLKKIEFFYYACHALVLGIYFLFYEGYLDLALFPSNPEYNSFLWLLPNLAAVFYFSFIRIFLNTKVQLPRWDKYFKLLIRFTLIAFIVNVTYVTFTLDIYRSAVVLNLVNIFMMVNVIVFIFSLRNFKAAEVRYFIFGSLFLISTTLFASVQYLINLNADLIYYVQGAVSLELIFFIFGMGHKMKKIVENSSITQESLILQLIENERIQEKTNSELKEKVVERTHQINVRNVELRQARLEAEKATKTKSDFLSVMSHEIRTPLNAIISLSHLMDIDNENKDNEFQEYIDGLKFSAESLNSIINDILDYNKMEAGKLSLESVDFSLLDLLKNIRDSFKFKAKSKNITLNFSLSENTPNRIIGDPTRLTQIFNNLISNALKFTDQGKVEVFADLLGIENENVTIQFHVKDTGIGIAENKIKSIFQDFEQASVDTTRKYGGTGLGLSITKKLIQLHHSEIEVSSEVNQGTDFSFKLVFKLPEDFDLLSSGKINTIYDLKQSKILVVDDNYMNRLVLKRLFSIWNADFHEAENGNQACQKADQLEFDLILMDIHMGSMDGFECSEKIRNQSTHNKSTRIVALTACNKTDFEDLRLARNPYIDEVVSKPFNPKELLSKLITYLNG